MYYGKMEREHPDLSSLDFQGEDLLMRLVDDFLLVTPNKAVAQNFVKVMKNGNKDFGCFIHPEKSLVANFMDEDIPCLQDSACMYMLFLTVTPGFPWCGILINTDTLEIRSDLSRLSLFRMYALFPIPRYIRRIECRL